MNRHSCGRAIRVAVWVVSAVVAVLVVVALVSACQQGLRRPASRVIVWDSVHYQRYCVDRHTGVLVASWECDTISSYGWYYLRSGALARPPVMGERLSGGTYVMPTRVVYRKTTVVVHKTVVVRKTTTRTQTRSQTGRSAPRPASRPKR